MFSAFATSILLLTVTVTVTAGASLGTPNNEFSVTQDPEPGFSPNLGNGFIGYDVGCPCGDETSSAGNVFLAGTYSGQGSVDPSKRAMIPQHFSVYAVNAILGDEILQHSWEANLDIQQGLFTNTSTFSSIDGEMVCAISLTWLVHREIKDMMALHISTSVGTSGSCTVQLDSCNGQPSDQIVLLGSKPNYEVYRTAVSEVPGGDFHYVFVSHDHVPSTIEILSAQQKDHFYVSTFQSTAWMKSTLFSEEKHLDVNVNEKGLPDVMNALDQFQRNVGDRMEDLTWASLVASHTAAWNILWQSGIEVEGNDTIASSINASLYYIHSAVDANSLWSVSPGGLSKNSYNGHVFWDCETWILPALVPFYPSIVLAFEEYRRQRLPAALERAQVRGFSDAAAMLPWESAYTGMDVTPIGNYEGNFEIHVTADIPLAMRSVYYWTGNLTWLQEDVWPLIVACGKYLFERASCVDTLCESMSYMNVQPPDEKAGIINASVYTNAAAADLLSWIASRDSDFTAWGDLADKLIIPLSSELYTGGEVHPEYDGYNGEPINQADAVLLQFPLQFPMADDVAFNDLQYYAALTSVPGETKGFYTGDSSYSIAYMMLYRKGYQDSTTENEDLKQLADDQFQQAFEHIDLSAFYVWKEKVDGGHFNFLTGAGGFLQNCIYGYAGVEIGEGGLVVDSPLLPPGGVTFMKLRGVHFQSSVLNIGWNSSVVEVDVVEGSVTAYEFSRSSEWKFVEEVGVSSNNKGRLVVAADRKLKLVV